MKATRDVRWGTDGDWTTGEIEFRLVAPGKREVSLIGTFNDWREGRDSLRQDEDGVWTLEKDLGQGHHEYAFVADRMRIADPYARRVRWTEYGPVGVIEVPSQEYAWRHDEAWRPPFEDLVLYEIHTGDFSPEGTFDAVTQRLDYLRDLKVNGLLLMPVTVGDERDYWGYRPVFLFAVRERFGAADDLRRLVDEAHGRGMAVILDTVLAHTGRDHPYMQLYDWDHSPWYGESLSGMKNDFGLPTLDYRKEATQHYLRDVNQYWLRAYHVDGYRYDYAKLIGMDNGDGMPFLVKTAREVKPDAHLIAEHVPEDPKITDETGMSGVWHQQIVLGVEAMLTEDSVQDKSWDNLDDLVKMIDPTRDGYKSGQVWINYTESHDEGRVVEKVMSRGFDEVTARRKAALGIAIICTMPGQPMLFHGQEWGENSAKNEQENKIHWAKLETEGGRGLHAFARRMCQLVHEHSALRSAGFAVDAVDNDAKTLVYHRWNQEGDELLVALNLRGEQQALRIPFPSEGRWKEIFTDRMLETDGETSYEMEGYSPAIFVKQGSLTGWGDG